MSASKSYLSASGLDSPTRRLGNNSARNTPVSLSEKIDYVNLRKSNEAYQNLLIRTKEAEIAILNEQTKKKQLTRQSLQARQEVSKLEQAVQQRRKKLQQKSDFLQQQYSTLQAKLTSTPRFTLKITRLEQGLEHRFDVQKAKISCQDLLLKKQMLTEQIAWAKAQELKKAANQMKQKSQPMITLKSKRSQADETSFKTEENKLREEASQLKKQIQAMESLLRIDSVHARFLPDLATALASDLMRKRKADIQKAQRSLNILQQEYAEKSKQKDNREEELDNLYLYLQKQQTQLEDYIKRYTEITQQNSESTQVNQQDAVE